MPAAKSTFHAARDRYLDSATSADERGKLRVKLHPFIELVDSKEVIKLPGD